MQVSQTVDRSIWARVWTFLATWWQQIAITQAGIYLVASFGQSHEILPPAAAWTLAIGMEGTYLKGLIDAGHVRGKGQRWATALIISTYITVILWGIAYILSLPAVAVIPEKLSPEWGVFLASVHVLPIAITGLCSAMLHRARDSESAAKAARIAEEAEARARKEQERREEEDAAYRRERQQIELEAERKRAELAVWTEAQHRKAELRERSANSANSVRGEQSAVRSSASGTGTNTDANTRDEQLREQIVAALTNDPKTNRTALAASLGIGRTKLYELIDIAKQRGELH